MQRLLLVAVLCLPWATHAQSDTLTVADGAATDSYVPIYGLWADASQRNQMLYPASMLTDMTGAAITSLTYYMNSTSSNLWGTTVTIKMTEVTNTSLNALLPTTNATVVWTGTINGQNSTEEITLTTPYIYLGGNLLIEFTTTAATWSSASWYGVSQTGGSYYSYNSTSSGRDFLPKVRFIYEDAGDICLPPSNLTTSIDDSDVDITWNAGEGSTWQIAWGATGFDPDTETNNFASVSTNSYTLTGLSDGVYQVYVRTDCGSDYSNWVSTDFMIGGCSIIIVGNDSYGDGWNGASLDIVQGGTTIGTFTISSGSSATYTVNVSGALPVVFNWNSGSYDSEASFTVYNQSNVALYTSGSISSGTLFTLNSPCSGCFAPGGIHIDSLSSDYARVVWNGNADSYGIIWGEMTDVSGGTGTATTTSDTYFEMTGLNSGTGYTIKVWSLCDDNEISDTVTYSFATIGDAVSDFPYTTGFEAGDDIAWSFVNDATNQWTVGAGAAHSGTNGLYISNDNGNSNTYTVSGIQFSYAYRAIEITDAGQYAVAFDWKCNGEGSYDYLRAWIAPANAQFTAGTTPDGNTSAYDYTTATPDGWIDLGGKMNLESSWQTKTAVASLSAGNYFLVFMWANDNSAGSQPPAAIDNIEFRQLSCPQPTELTATPHSHEVDLSWTAGGDESVWEITISDTVVEYSQSNNYTVQNLEGYTYYHFAVRAICGDGDTSSVTTVSCRTLAGEPISEFPYICGFEVNDNDENEASVWVLENNTPNGWYVGTATNNGGSRALYISNDNGASNAYTVTTSCVSYAYVTFDMDPGEYTYSFDWKAYGESSWDFLRAAIAPAGTEMPNDSWTSSMVAPGFTTIDGGYMNLQNGWQTKTGTFTVETPGIYNFYFVWRNDGSSGSQPPAAVDNVMIALNTCPAPTAFTLDTIEAFQATLDWNPVGDESEWVIRAVSPTITDEWQTASSHPYVYTGLNSGTNYFFQLRAVCAADDSSLIVSCSGSTPITCPAPTSFSVNVSGDTANFSWTDANGTAWELVSGEVGFNPDNAGNEESVTSTTYQMTGLSEGIFEVYLRRDCGDGDHSVWVGPVSVNTLPQYIMAATGTDTLYTCNMTIYDCGGSEAVYTTDNDSYLYVYPSDADHVLQISGFSYTESNYDYLRITDLLTGQVIFCDNSTPNGQMIPELIAYGGVELYFHSDYSNQYDGFQVNLSCVDAPTCLPISGLTLDHATSDGLDIVWVDTVNSGANYYVEYHQQGAGASNWDDVVVSNTEANLSGLDPNTMYDIIVRAVCGDGDTSFASTGSFRTLCGEDTIPYIYGFEDVASFNCWQSYNNNSASYPYRSTSYSHSGSNSLYFYASSTVYSYAVLPPLDAEINTLMVNFWSRSSSSSYTGELKVGVITNPGDLSTFTPMATCVPNGTTWTLHDVSLTGYEGDGGLIAILCEAGSSNYVYLDDITVATAPSCSQIRDLEVGAVTTGGAYIHWNPGVYGSYNGAVVEYRDTVSGSWTSVSTSDTYVVLSGLTDGTYYEVRVASNCDNETSQYVYGSFTTVAFGCEYDPNSTLNATVGNGSTTNSYMPSYSLYNYSYTQQFYKASEIGGSGQITQITLTPSAITNQRTLEIYMGQSNDTAASSFITPDGLTCVYNGGQVPLVANQPVTFVFTTPFDYSDTSNLVVIFRDMTGTYRNGNQWLGDQAWSGASCYAYRDTGPYAIPATESATSGTFRNKITFFGGQCIGVTTCSEPAAWVNGVSRDSVYLEWIPGGSETSWVVYYETAGNMTYAGTSTSTNYAVGGLSGLTDYTFHIGAICNGDTLMTSVSATTTASEDAYEDFPFVCTFDSINMNEFWQRVGQGQDNKWYIGAVDSNNVLMVSDDNGASNHYNTSSTSASHAYVRLSLTSGEYFYSYNWKAQGESSYDYLLAYIVPDSYTPTAGSYTVPANAIRIDGGSYMNQSNSWQTQSGTINISNGGIYKMVFTWRNDDIAGTQPPASVDNVMFSLNTCPVPTGFTATVTGDAVDFAWSDPTGSNWEIVYGNMGLNPNNAANVNTSTTESYNASGLADGFYDAYLRKDCGNGDYSLWVGPVSFSIGINVINMNAGFDTLNSCNAIIYDDGGANGSYSNSRNDQLVIYPSDATKRFIFWGSGSTESGYDYLKIFEGDQAVGTPLATIEGNGIVIDTVWTYGGPITLQFHSDGSTVRDGFEIFIACVDMPSCTEVANLVAVGNTSSSVTLDWGSYTGNDYSWIVSYSTTPLADPMTGTTTAVSSHPYTVTGLTSGTDYYFYVRNDCGTDSSMWRVVGPVRPGVWTMNPNQVDTLYMCGGTIYDDGGVSGSYSSSQNSTIILRPDTPNTLVSVSGSTYTEGSYDYLTIYDGIGTNGTELWNNYGTSTTTFGPIESMSGSLTIVFVSDGYVNHDGFEIDVTCVSALCRVLNLTQNASVSESSSQIAVTWDPVTDAQQYQIEYGLAGFAHGQGQTMTSITNSAVVTGLTPLTTYDIYVRSLCTGGDTGSWSRITLRTAMCDGPVEALNYDTTQMATTSIYSPVGYSYYNYSYVQTIIPAARLTDLAGEINAMAFNASTGSAGSVFTNMTVWMSNVSEDNFSDDYFILPDPTHVFYKVIDSADFSYSDAGWQVHSLDTAFVWDGVSNILVSVLREHGSYSSGASFVAHNDTVERTIYAYRDASTYDPASMVSGTSNDVVGDIKLISCGGGCARPNGLHATNVNYAGATLNWFGTADSYEVAVKPATVGTWPAETVVNGATSFNATGLAPNTQYQFRVRAICDAAEGRISDWVVAGFVTDELPCFAPEDLHTTGLGITTATLAWNAEAGQQQWSIHVWNTANDYNYTADANPMTVTGLTANTTYFAAVKTICGNGAAESEYSDTIQFTTNSCAQVTGVTVSNITANSAVVSWTSTGADRYILEYGDQNFSAGQGTRITVDNATTYTLSDLEPNYDYSVFVRAVCEDGVNGEWSEQVDFTTIDGVGISTVEGSMKLSVYPNPATDATVIAVSGVNGEVQITLVDMNGRTVMSDSMSCESDCTKRMEVSGLAQGAYFVRVNGENLNMVKKLVIK